MERDFQIYIKAKKLRLLYWLYERLYSFVKYRSNDFSKWRIHKPSKCERDFYVEYKGTEFLTVEDRLKIHSLLYKKLKPKNVQLGKNGQVLLWPIKGKA